MNNLATLGLKVDSSGVMSGGAQAEAALNRITESAAKTMQKLAAIKVDWRSVTQPVASIRDSFKDMFQQIESTGARVTALKVQREELELMKGSIPGVTQQYTGLAAAIGSLAGPLAAVLSASAITQGIAKQIELGNEVGRTAAKLGIAAQDFSELTFAAGKFGLQASHVSSALVRMQQEIASGGDTLKRLGLNMDELRRLSPDRQFEIIGQRIGEIKDRAVQTTAALQIFGQAGDDLVPLFSRGAEGIRAAREEAQRLGIVVTDEMVVKFQAADAAMKEIEFLKQSFWANVAIGAITVAEALKLIKPPAVVEQKDQLDDLLTRRRNFYQQLANLEKENPINKADQVAVITENLRRVEAQINIVNGKLLNLGKQSTPTSTLAIDTLKKPKAASTPDSASIPDGLSYVQVTAKSAADVAAGAYQRMTEAQTAFYKDGVEQARATNEFFLDMYNKLPSAAQAAFDEVARDQATMQSKTVADQRNNYNDLLRELGIYSDEVVLTYEQMNQKIDEQLARRAISEEQAAAARKAAAQAEIDARFDAAHDLFGGLSSLMSTHTKEAFEIGKAGAIANATVYAMEAIIGAFRAPTWWQGVAQGVAATAMLYSRISQLKNVEFQGYMSGGYTGDMPTNEPAGIVHGREYVLNAATTARVGREQLDALNTGRTNIISSRAGAANASSYSGAPIGNMKLVIENHGTPQTYERSQGMTADEVRYIARDVVANDTPKVFASQMRDANSPISQAVTGNTTASRRR